MSHLSFAPLHRARAAAGSRGGSRNERHSLDFVVDGTSLFDSVQAARFDLVGLLGWSSIEHDRESIRCLLLELATTLPTSRQSLFVCAECGDIGCGAITVSLSHREGHYVWEDFAYENNYDPSMTDRKSFADIGPFVFLENHYRKVLADALVERPGKPGGTPSE